MYKMNNLRQHLKQEYKDHIVVVNDHEYVSIDVLQEAVYNLAMSDAVIGALVVKFGNIEVSEEDIIDYMTEYTNNVEVKFDRNKFTAKRV
jgi:hypothetical protein